MTYQPPKWLPLIGVALVVSTFAAVSSFGGNWRSDLPAFICMTVLDLGFLMVLWCHRPRRKIA
jgi:hypothetical protein